MTWWTDFLESFTRQSHGTFLYIGLNPAPIHITETVNGSRLFLNTSKKSGKMAKFGLEILKLCTVLKASFEKF
jgi:hypothetical protein